MKKHSMIGMTFALILSTATFCDMTAFAASSDTTVENLSITTARITRYHHTAHSEKHMQLQVHSCSFTDADGNGICDNCYWDETYHAGHHAGACSGFGVSCHIADGYCTNYTDTDNNGFCDSCHNPVYCVPAVNGQNSSSGQLPADSQAGTGQVTTQQPATDNAGSSNAAQSSTDNSYSIQDYGYGYFGHHGCRRSGHHGGHH